MKISKCFFCDKDMLDDSVETHSKQGYIDKNNDRKEFYITYGYIKVVAGKIGNKPICNHCSQELNGLVYEQINDAVTDLENELAER